MTLLDVLPRGQIILISGVIILFASLVLMGYASNDAIWLLEYDMFVTIHPGESISRGFDTADEDKPVTFFLDYGPRGNNMNLSIVDSSEKIIFDKKFNDYFIADEFNLNPNSYYVAKIANIGSEVVDVYDAGFHNSLKTDERGNFILPLEQTDQQILSYLFFTSIILMIIGLILIVVDRKKKNVSKNGLQ